MTAKAQHARATPADIFRIWKRLWGDLDPDFVAFMSASVDGEAYDASQLTDREIAELE